MMAPEDLRHASQLAQDVNGYLDQHDISARLHTDGDGHIVLAFRSEYERANAYLWLNEDGYRLRHAAPLLLVVRPARPY